MGAIFNILAVPLGWLLHFIYQFIPNYFVSIFLFTLLVRAITFPLSLKSQKSQADRAKLAPRLERLQKKYAQDKQKLQQKQMELYEKEGVSLTRRLSADGRADGGAVRHYLGDLQAADPSAENPFRRH